MTREQLTLAAKLLAAAAKKAKTPAAAETLAHLALVAVALAAAPAGQDEGRG
jgi:hypothetical protein